MSSTEYRAFHSERPLFNLDIKSNNLTILWQRSFHDDDKIPRALGHDTIALSAFNLSSLPTSLARKTLVKEMWESGAHAMVCMRLE